MYLLRTPGHVRILISSRVLFDMEEAAQIYKEQGPDKVLDYLRARGEYAKDYDPEIGGRRLKPGPLWHFAKAITEINKKFPGSFELGLFTKNKLETALPIFRNVDVSGIEIDFRVATGGKPLSEAYLKSFHTDVYFGRNTPDVQTATNLGVAAAVINYPPDAVYERQPGHKLQLFLDGDAVMFGDSAEANSQQKGLDEHIMEEFNSFANPIEPSNFTPLLVKLSELNSHFPPGEEPIEISLLTARGGISAARALSTIEQLGIKVNGNTYCISAGSSGVSKQDVLTAHKPDLFLDDHPKYVGPASQICPAGQVFYKVDSPMYNLVKKRELENGNGSAPTASGTTGNPGGPTKT